jgi:hypothetical protein
VALPDVGINIIDNSLGLIAPLPDGVGAIIGPSQSGTANVVTKLNDPATALSTFGYGPLTEAAVLQMRIAQRPVLAVKTPSSTAGAAGAVTATRVGTSTGTVTVAGAALDSYSVKVLITKTGALGAGAFQYSLDGGLNYVGPITIPSGGTYVLPNTGHTLTFVPGGGPTIYEAGDYHTFSSTAPTSSSAEISAALDALAATAYQFDLVHILCSSASVAAAATLFDTVKAKMLSMEAAFRYAWAVLPSPTDTDANQIAGFAGKTDVHMGVGAGDVWFQSLVSARQMLRNVAWGASIRSAKVPAGEDLGRVARGPLDLAVSLVRDERVTPGLDEAGFITARTHIGLDGVFLTNGRLMSGLTTDFRYSQYREVMNLAATIARNAGLTFLNDTIRVDPVTGLILEVEARRIEQFIQNELAAVLLVPDPTTQKPAASGLRVVVDRTTNILSTMALVVRVSVIPNGYAKFITETLSFLNPALQGT